MRESQYKPIVLLPVFLVCEMLTRRYEYRWADGVLIKKPIEVSAPKYVEYLMDWIESQLDDESIFPQKLGAPFPSNFREVVKTIFSVYSEFGLIDKKELAPLQELIESIIVPY
ncbi:hypothetical protein GIB67_042619 [Kingdonia uniflora]|uniref:Uncharacterized protein n=1 Tax=Kingdonia uniflora TaxID=39325 RepID=A0A7J7M1H5_9MAGN|nr:hypothetical protein GIB67_042619 [Kingdonia uniflora]